MQSNEIIETFRFMQSKVKKLEEDINECSKIKENLYYQINNLKLKRNELEFEHSSTSSNLASLKELEILKEKVSELEKANFVLVTNNQEKTKQVENLKSLKSLIIHDIYSKEKMNENLQTTLELILSRCTVLSENLDPYLLLTKSRSNKVLENQIKLTQEQLIQIKSQIKHDISQIKRLENTTDRLLTINELLLERFRDIKKFKLMKELNRAADDVIIEIPNINDSSISSIKSSSLLDSDYNISFSSNLSSLNKQIIQKNVLNHGLSYIENIYTPVFLPPSNDPDSSKEFNIIAKQSQKSYSNLRRHMSPLGIIRKDSLI
jgi:DNA repair exonuclease SbcCD ATPase subunit